jgi:succinate dehydrogenase flavin-adding protein (antitoxin of CptAB toxin-antitoxin module)
MSREGLMEKVDWDLYRLVEQAGPVNSRELRQMAKLKQSFIDN